MANWPLLVICDCYLERIFACHIWRFKHFCFLLPPACHAAFLGCWLERTSFSCSKFKIQYGTGPVPGWAKSRSMSQLLCLTFLERKFESFERWILPVSKEPQSTSDMNYDQGPKKLVEGLLLAGLLKGCFKQGCFKDKGYFKCKVVGKISLRCHFSSKGILLGVVHCQMWTWAGSSTKVAKCILSMLIQYFTLFPDASSMWCVSSWSTISWGRKDLDDVRWKPISSSDFNAADELLRGRRKSFRLVAVDDDSCAKPQIWIVFGCIFCVSFNLIPLDSFGHLALSLRQSQAVERYFGLDKRYLQNTQSSCCSPAQFGDDGISGNEDDRWSLRRKPYGKNGVCCAWGLTFEGLLEGAVKLQSKCNQTAINLSSKLVWELACEGLLEGAVKLQSKCKIKARTIK